MRPWSSSFFPRSLGSATPWAWGKPCSPLASGTLRAASSFPPISIYGTAVRPGVGAPFASFGGRTPSFAGTAACPTIPSSAPSPASSTWPPGLRCSGWSWGPWVSPFQGWLPSGSFPFWPGFGFPSSSISFWIVFRLSVAGVGGITPRGGNDGVHHRRNHAGDDPRL
jgi:hypothetical protein